MIKRSNVTTSISIRPIRLCAQCRRSYSSKSYGEQLGKLAEQQDPYRRIRFYPPVRRFFEKGSYARIELHYLPFWTVFYSWRTRDLTHNRRAQSEYLTSCTAVAICAVDKYHWASGLIYALDPSRDTLRTETSPASWLDSAEFSDRQGVWSATSLAAFKKGYPATLPRSYAEEIEGRSFHTENLSTFAFPTYRAVHRFTFADETTVVGNASGHDLPILWNGTSLNYPTKTPDPRPQISYTQWEKAVALRAGSHVSMPMGTPSVIRQTLFDLSMESKQAQLDWSDSRIFPAETEGRLSIRSIWHYNLRRMWSWPGRPLPEEPLYPMDTLTARRVATFRPTALSPATATTTTSLSAPPLRKVVDAPDRSSTSHPSPSPAAERISRPPSDDDLTRVPRDLPRPRPALTFDPARSSNTITSGSPQSESERETPTIHLGPPKAPRSPRPPRARAPQSSTIGRPSLLANASRKPMAHERIADPEGKYALLGIVPTTQLTDPLNPDYGSKIVTQAKIRLSRLHHPDRTGHYDRKKKEASAKILVRINRYCEELKTVKQRIAYSRV